jgi:hypothetical protein
VIQGATDPAFLEIIKAVGAPVATALGSIYFYHKFIAPKSNGKEAKERDEQHTREIMFKIDLALTEHFDQLRRDLETKIDKTMENWLTAYLYRRELERQKERR